MQSVFVSYSHTDSTIADRLVQDLRNTDILATYDKWLLQVGDSLIEKISSAVSSVDRVIALLSSASVQSEWVKKELAIAMTSEINDRSIVILPALLETCDIPAMLKDKVFADFRDRYFEGLRALLQSLSPSQYSQEPHFRAEGLDTAARELREHLQANDMDQLRRWFMNMRSIPAYLFGNPWSVREAIPNFRVGDEFADYLVVSGQSFRYDFTLVMLGDPKLSIGGTDALIAEARRMQRYVAWCDAHADIVRRSIALRLASSYGAEQIAPDAYGIGKGFDVNAKLILGRRDEYGTAENQLRTQIYKSNTPVEVVTYDRVVDALDRIAVRGLKDLYIE